MTAIDRIDPQGHPAPLPESARTITLQATATEVPAPPAPKPPPFPWRFTALSVACLPLIGFDAGLAFGLAQATISPLEAGWLAFTVAVTAVAVLRWRSAWKSMLKEFGR